MNGEGFKAECEYRLEQRSVRKKEGNENKKVTAVRE